MKHLNMWVNAAHNLISHRDWQACFTPNMDIEDFHSDPCTKGWTWPANWTWLRDECVHAQGEDEQETLLPVRQVLAPG